MLGILRFIFISLLATTWIGGSALGAERYRTVIASYNPEARQAAKTILEAGGNAFDAFVAATLAEYVVGPGVTSMAGPLGAMVYDAKTKSTLFLDATYNVPAALNAPWHAGDADGKAVLIPGALKGLEALSMRFGKLSFAKACEPAIKLAKDGFQISATYAAILKSQVANLTKSAYGQKTFFKNGSPLPAGALLRQTEVAETLTGLAQRGSEYFYQGPWAKAFENLVGSAGGVATAADLARYEVHWRQPRKIQYRGYELNLSSGRTFGALWEALALKTLEHTSLDPSHPYWSHAASLAMLIKIARVVWTENWLMSPAILDDEASVLEKFTPEYTHKIWDKARSANGTNPAKQTGTHSFHVIVADADGNIVTGTNTIESYPWGDGLFVDGVPLNNSGKLPYTTKPTERAISPLGISIAFKNGMPAIATGSFNYSLTEAGFQFLVNAIDYQMDGRTAATQPRFGSFPIDLISHRQDSSKNWLDPEVDKLTVMALETFGVKVSQDGYVDTGSGAVVTREKDSLWSGEMPVLRGFDNTVDGL